MARDTPPKPLALALVLAAAFPGCTRPDPPASASPQASPQASLPASSSSTPVSSPAPPGAGEEPSETAAAPLPSPFAASTAGAPLSAEADRTTSGSVADRATKAPAEEPAPEIFMMNFNDTEGATLLRALGTVVQKHVTVDPAAQPLVDCSVVTMHAGQVSPAAAVLAVAATLRPKGLLVAETAGVIHVRRAPDAAPCPGKH